MLERLSLYAEVWWIYLLFGLLQFALGEGLAYAYGRIRDWLDRRHPDDLPLPAGEGLVERIGTLGFYDLLVGLAPEKEKQLDAYGPSAKLILLTPKTYAKNDAWYWAVAAHELGHAVADRGSLLYELLTRGARASRNLTVSVAAIIFFANVFYRLSALNALAFGIFGGVHGR